ncbi:protein of unknown function [Paraburkholderia kururiensis]
MMSCIDPMGVKKRRINAFSMAA